MPAFGDAPSDDLAAGAYLLDDAQGRRFVNVNIQRVQDLKFERAQFRVRRDGETQQGTGRTLLGKQIDGRLVQRSFSTGMGSSEVRLLLEDRISLRVSVEKAANPDEAFEILKLLDVEGLAAAAR